MPRQFSEEHRKNLSIAHKGQISKRKGRIFVDPEISKEKRKAYRKKWNIENHDKIIEADRIWKQKNREKVAMQARLRYQNNPQKELDRIRFKKYGITGDEFRFILNNQNNQCLICVKQDTKNLSVDHNHQTGKIRGIICNDCNVVLGRVRDSIKTLKSMIKYLEKYNG